MSKQTSNLQYFDQYIRNVDFSYISPFGEIGAPDSYVVNASFRNSFMIIANKNWPVAMSITPEVVARVRKEVSAGVRTPSFKIAGNLHYRLSRSFTRYKYAEAGFTHHSNGQDGEALNPDGSLNTVTGNFTTNFITAAYRFGHFRQSRRITGTIYSFNHKAGIELHRLFKFEKAIKSDYGFTRLVYQFSLRSYGAADDENSSNIPIRLSTKEKWRLNADASYATNAIQGYGGLEYERRFNGEVSFHYSLPFMGNTYAMAALGYYGEDPYNIYYRNHYGYLRLGISASISKYLTRNRL
ncbi:MAG: hypothetical protein EOO89_29965 [Pedobacter sp.]|nr:MAG: hypothetical protein EOO89_29965 [Pedobacter sp.]